ncbi:MAG: radical SAM family heme chaperone HemW [Clostridia bacterium]|nr:radical SAM family heme chaperone HemW [Clostridia bacterium]
MSSFNQNKSRRDLNNHSSFLIPHSSLSIYIHVPFCAKKCAYCDFASFSGREADWGRYFEEIMAEIRLWSEMTDFGLLSEKYRIKTLFIGGGTPTLVDAGYIEKTIDACRRIAPFEPGAEITAEGNPGTLTPGKLAAYRRAGVNRLSLGAQSFDEGLLRSLGRIHTAGQIGEAVTMAREAGFDNINLDLMYALPGQGMDQWTDALDAAIALGVEHLSAYSLIVEPGTPMAARVASGAATVPDDDAVNAMQRQAIARLDAAGYRRYEISNYARPGRECRHNLVYWNRGDYLGLGCAAHSLLGGRRFHNPESLDDYLAGVRRQDEVRLTLQDEMEETLMLSTRTVRGLDLAAWENAYGAPFERGREAAMGRLEKGGLIEIGGGHLRLTTRGMEVQDAVVLELLGENE